MSRYINPVTFYDDVNGEPLANGLLYFYESGTNDTKITYADVNESIPNTQPLVLNGNGTVPNCFYTGSAKVVLASSEGVQIWERDPVMSIEVSSFGDQWDSVSIYGFNDVVTFNNDLFISIIPDNQNNNPASDLSAWTQFRLLKLWNANETYSVRDAVIATDFTIYISTVAGNIGNDPTGTGTDWAASGAGSGATFAFADWDSSTNYSVGSANIVTGSDGNYYISLLINNINNNPISEPTFWKRVQFIEDGTINGSIDVTGDINIDGVVGLSDGSAALPSLTFQSDEDTGLFLENTGVMGVTVNGSKVGSFDVDGFNGLATNATNATNCSRSVLAGNGLTGGGELDSNVTLTVGQGSGIAVGASAINVDSSVVRTTGTQTIGGSKTITNLINLDNGANITNGLLSCTSSNSSDFVPALTLRRTTNTNTTNRSYIDFRRSSSVGGQIVGSITCDQDSTNYGQSSDYRLKDDIKNINSSCETLSLLKPINFRWISSGKRVDGFIAHELAEVIPAAVTGEKDGVDELGEPVYQGIDQSKIVPLLTAALQEALARIEALEAQSQ